MFKEIIVSIVLIYVFVGCGSENESDGVVEHGESTELVKPPSIPSTVENSPPSRAPILDDYPSSMETAELIELNTTINGSIETIDDSDYFKFVLESGDGVVIDNASSNNALGIELLTLINGTVKELARNSMYSNPSTIAVLNLDAGVYYIGVHHNSNHSGNYVFTLKINDGDNSIVYLDQTTVDYCKSNPTECGLDTGIYEFTDADLSEAYQQGKADGAISYAITAADIESLGNGWHLLGTQSTIEDFSIFHSVKSVWYWDNGWRAYSPVTSIYSTIEESADVGRLDVIYPHRGFWVFK